jgi:hypothetical protein
MSESNALKDINLDFKFVNEVQDDFFYCGKRNQNYNGSFGNGKSFGASMKAVTLLATFPYYRIGISRYSSKELSQSTMSTFFKVCPQELYNEAYGGRRNDRDGYLRLINGSEVLWMHLDDYSEEDLRGKEFNSVITDQGEEIAENIYTTLDARIERWDKAEIPSYLNPERFPKNKFTGKPMAPCYNILLFNPDTTLHWIYRMFHPDSPTVENLCGPLESKKLINEYSGSWYYRDAAFFSASMDLNPAIPDSLKAAYLKREKSWVDRFYFGKWGIAGGAIHYVPDSSIISMDRRETRPAVLKLLEVIKKDGIKYRVMDHGEAAPTCVLWFAYLSSQVLWSAYGIKSKGIHICYREYYQPGKIIKYHREAIAALSADERYHGNFADPAIFKKNQQKYGGFWRTADDYLDHTGWTEAELKKAPAITWEPADNNEMSCRDAIQEMLQLDPEVYHPITGEPNSPSLYFIRRHPEYPHGVAMALAQTQSARRKRIAVINGEEIYSDERADGDDHAYDPVRYYAIMPKTYSLPVKPAMIPQFSFNNHLMKRRRFGYKTP